MLFQNLPSWSVDSFEPLISSETMFVHVHKLHKGYVDKLNTRFKNSPILDIPPSEILSDIRGFLEPKDQDFYQDMMGGNVTHTLLWKILSPKPNPIKPTNRFVRDFNLNIENLKAQIKQEGLNRFGSGWVWGALDSQGNLKIYSTKNHDTPYMRRQTPLFCIDVWEHAYFLDRHGDRKVWLDIVCEFIDFGVIDMVYQASLRGEDLLDFWSLQK
jgi:superoxide dismutase, Fe-Mn family